MCLNSFQNWNAKMEKQNGVLSVAVLETANFFREHEESYPPISVNIGI